MLYIHCQIDKHCSIRILSGRGIIVRGVGFLAPVGTGIDLIIFAYHTMGIINEAIQYIQQIYCSANIFF